MMKVPASTLMIAKNHWTVFGDCLVPWQWINGLHRSSVGSSKVYQSLTIQVHQDEMNQLQRKFVDISRTEKRIFVVSSIIQKNS